MEQAEPKSCRDIVIKDALEYDICDGWMDCKDTGQSCQYGCQECTVILERYHKQFEALPFYFSLHISS